jgi:predicted GIY-YIG superfamily endonuclease
MTKPIRKKWVKENPDRIRQLQYKASMKWLKKLPGGVYLIQTDKGLYVGQSEHVKWRISQHKHSNQFSVTKTMNANILSWVMLEAIEDPDLRRERELYWIKKLQPELNTRGK